MLPLNLGYSYASAVVNAMITHSNLEQILLEIPYAQIFLHQNKFLRFHMHLVYFNDWWLCNNRRGNTSAHQWLITNKSMLLHIDFYLKIFASYVFFISNSFI